MIEQILSEAESLLPESHVAILAREVKRLRERPDADALQKLLNEAYRKGSQDAHAARDACVVILPESVPVAWIVGGIGGDHFTDFEKAKTIAATYGKEPTPLYLHPQRGGADLRGLTDEEAQAIADQFSIETTKYTVFRIWGIAQSKVQRGGAVVVPEPTSDEWRDIAAKAISADLADFLSGAAAYGLWLRGKVETVPADRVLKKGQCAIGIYEMQMLRDFAARRMSQREHDRLEACRDAHEDQLRSATGGV